MSAAKPVRIRNKEHGTVVRIIRTVDRHGDLYWVCRDETYGGLCWLSVDRAIEDGSYQRVAELKRLVREVADGADGVFLVLMPLHYIWRYRPRFVMLEQVRAVLPIWQAYLAEMAKWGYGGETRVVRFEQYGVPQTRQRAILLARHESAGLGPARIPDPTHSRFHERSPERLDAGVEKWVSMREALGWEVDRPAPTVTGGGASSGGAEPFAAGGRRAIAAALELWHGRQPKSTGGAAGITALPDHHEQGATNDVVGMKMLANHSNDPRRMGVMRPVDAPAPTVTGHVDRNRWHLDGPRVVTGQQSRQAGGEYRRYDKSIDVPAPTVTGQVRSWRLAGAGAAAEKTSGQRPRELDQPAHTITGGANAVWIPDGREGDVPQSVAPLNDRGGRGGLD